MFNWKFKKPVTKSTLTSNGYTWPEGAPDPTSDILKAQMKEIRDNIDSAHNLIMCNSKYVSDGSYYSCSTQRTYVLWSAYSTQCSTLNGNYCTAAYGMDQCTTVQAPHYTTYLGRNGSCSRDCDTVQSSRYSGDCMTQWSSADNPDWTGYYCSSRRSALDSYD